MKHTLVLVLLVLAAASSYVAGSVAGLLVLVGMGVLFELAFWFGLVQRRRGKARHA
ncbi:hypothetical protein QFZ41_000257 [Luteibacter sp. W1I16]|uniref:hypothetical protein n=1 Tax=Luteibacter sp. W1I16 TaxID=3373922 RepID=UPI003D22CA36